MNRTRYPRSPKHYSTRSAKTFISKIQKTDLVTLFRTLRQPNLPESQKKVGDFWNTLTEYRNNLRHSGMKAQRINLSKVEEFVDQWHKIKSEAPFDVQVGGEQGRLLISPIGHTPGVLYSAIEHIHPDRCLTICSPQTVGHIENAIDQSQFYLPSVKKIVLEDPHTATDLLDTESASHRSILLSASEVYVNVTGGTTLMGLLTERLYSTAVRLQRPAYRFGLVDTRSREAQRNNPFVRGEMIEIDEIP